MKLAAFFAALAAVAACNSHPSTDKRDAPAWVGQTKNALTIRAIDNQSTYLKQLVDQVPPSSVVKGATDMWRGEDAAAQTEPYLYGPSPEAIAAYLATRPAPPAGEQIAFEKLGTDRWRTHLVDASAALDATAIVQAEVTDFDGRPGLMVELTRNGGREFAALTAEHVGHKLAIEANGKIVMSPVIESKITGGKVAITLGAGATQADAEKLADALAL